MRKPQHASMVRFVVRRTSAITSLSGKRTQLMYWMHVCSRPLPLSPSLLHLVAGSRAQSASSRHRCTAVPAATERSAPHQRRPLPHRWLLHCVAQASPDPAPPPVHALLLVLPRGRPLPLLLLSLRWDLLRSPRSSADLARARQDFLLQDTAVPKDPGGEHRTRSRNQPTTTPRQSPSRTR